MSTALPHAMTAIAQFGNSFDSSSTNISVLEVGGSVVDCGVVVGSSGTVKDVQTLEKCKK